MNKYLFLFFLICFSIVFSQNDPTTIIVENDASGGSFTMEIDKDLLEALTEKEESICNNTIHEPPRPLTPAEKCATQQKIMGFKIQILYTKDRETAERVKNSFAKNFPSLTPELIYVAPDYRILVGDYFTRKSASSDLKRIQRSYPSAFPIQYRIWCRKAI